MLKPIPVFSGIVISGEIMELGGSASDWVSRKSSVRLLSKPVFLYKRSSYISSCSLTSVSIRSILCRFNGVFIGELTSVLAFGELFQGYFFDELYGYTPEGR